MLLIDSVTKDLSPWIDAFKQALGEDSVVTWDEVQDFSAITLAVVWNHRPQLFSSLPNLKLVASLGAGVDHILRDELLPKDMPVSKVISHHLSGPMANFCIGAVMYFHRQFDKYVIDKQLKKWDQQFDPEVPVKIGILGLGTIGQELAKRLVALDFEVAGLSSTKKHIPGVVCYDSEGMDDFLAETNMLIAMLPHTPKTEGMLNKELLMKMPKGAYLINVGRGKQQVDEDILDCLDSGQLAGAFLDVFPEEPLPEASPMWEHPKVFITPHIAVVTKLEAAVPQIVENYRRLEKGEPLTNLIDRNKGY